jgi:uncharacterized protein (UPF0333 family)
MSVKKNYKNKKGQVVFEYILVMFAIIAMGAAAYVAIKRNLPKQLKIVKDKMEQDAWSGGKPPAEYYKDVRYKVK